jgi:hypothetical protein
MTSFEKEGFIAGYQSKEANPRLAAVAGAIAGAVTKYSGSVIKFILPLLFMAPAVVGSAGGLIHSKATSPSPMDISGAQKALELSELEEFATELTRRREAVTSQGKKEKIDARTLRL